VAKSQNSIVDGIFLPEGACAQEALYWGPEGRGPIEINLAGTFLISSAIVQADAHSYLLLYRDISGTYQDWGVIAPGTTPGHVTTRPNGNDRTQRQRLPSVLATGVAIVGNHDATGLGFAVSEVQVFGTLINPVDIGASLANPTFNGTFGNCPTSWVCDGSPAPGFSSYKPTTLDQFPGGVPFSSAAFGPTILGGSGAVRQITPLTWTAGTTYVLNLAKGLPLTLPDNSTFVAGWPQTVRLYLTTAAREEVAFFDIPPPQFKGVFEDQAITFTLPANSPFVGKKIAVVLFVSAQSLYSANFDFANAFTEITAVAEDAQVIAGVFPKIGGRFSGWANFSGASGQIEVDMLQNGNGPSACDSPCDSEKFWVKNVASVRPDLQARPPIANAGIQYGWQVDVQPTCCWPLGGTQRFRFRAILDADLLTQVILPVIEIPDPGFQHRLREWILNDPGYTVAETAQHFPPLAPPVYLQAQDTLDPATTLKYYQYVGTNPDGTGPSIAASIPTKERFLNRYFDSISVRATATYYNRGDLGIGRQMHCTVNKTSKETACYVENYGDGQGNPLFGSIGSAYDGLLAGKPFATVAMVERGKMDFAAPNKVFFVVYGSGSDPAGCPAELRCQAQLDNFGNNKSIPGNCMVCHGSASRYSNTAGPEVTKAYFLPFDLQSFDYFSTNDQDPLSRAAQEPSFQQLNQMVYFTDLFFNPAAKDLIDGWYAPNGLGSKFQNDFVPQGWLGNANDKRLYGAVVALTCRTCHISHTAATDPAGSLAEDHLRFATFDDFDSLKTTILMRTCIAALLARPMPNAEQTSNTFWKSHARGYLLDGLNITSQGCGLDPPATTSGAQSLSTVQFSFLGVLQQYKTESCTCTTKECLKQVENKYVGQIPAMNLNDPSAEQIISEVVKCHQQIVPTASPPKSAADLLFERDQARAKVFGP
jgi:hypothetical protein